MAIGLFLYCLTKMRILFSYLFLFLFSSAGFSQVSATLTASPDEIGKNDYFTLRINISGADAIINFIPPSFDQFIVISGPMHESSMSNINGVTSRSTGISFVLKPKATGRFTLEPAKIKLKSGEELTNKVTINVSKNPSTLRQQPSGQNILDFDPFNAPEPTIAYSDIVVKKGEDISQKVKKNMELRLQTNKTTCFVGEPVLAEYKLYSRLRSESRLTRSPSFNGFSVVDINDQNPLNFHKENLNGRTFNVYSIRKAQLYPLQPGSYTLDPAELENNIQFLKEDNLNQANGRRGTMEDALLGLPPEAYINQKILLHSTPVTITVKPLPTQHKPDDFSGAVGRFTLDAKLEKDSMGINESGKLVVTLSGEGNFQLLTAPKISWPKDLDSFDPGIKSNISNKTFPISGNKIFTFYFSANRQGEFVIPPVSFSYFNPKETKYTTLHTTPVRLFVTHAVANPASRSTLTTSSSPDGLNQIFYHRWWIIAVFALLALTGLFFWLKKTGKENGKNHMQAINTGKEIMVSRPEEIEFLSETKACLHGDNSNLFFSVLSKEYKQFLAKKFEVPVTAISTQQINSVLAGKSVPKEDIDAAQSILKDIEAFAYMPFEQNDLMQPTLDRALNSIEKLSSL